MSTWIAGHRKAIAGFLSALGGVLAVIASHQEWGTWAQYAGIGVAVLGAAGVYRVPNTAPRPAPSAQRVNVTTTKPPPV